MFRRYNSDACAGVGGKSTHLAELSDDAAKIDAADRSETKLGLAGPYSAYPIETHLRGLAGHVALGLGTETGIQLLGG